MLEPEPEPVAEGDRCSKVAISPTDSATREPWEPEGQFSRIISFLLPRFFFRLSPKAWIAGGLSGIDRWANQLNARS